ncbi:ABC transporter permease [Antarcticirhabdus aurantiaca]|uniref:ABC transporter permease n=1 Tax=Antarcticirhabdus aurantiaca TaxID=2606717 RepID=A0ACD4NNM3_9HYPH|nr:ABC transporter permease [Antarcticirhabdus aurantiaca]WAJ28348.1 ABC transporter permease [Jeongeuplla avenae]
MAQDLAMEAPGSRSRAEASPAGQAPARRRSRTWTPFAAPSSSQNFVLASAVWALIAGCWAALSYGGVVSSMFLPTPTAVFERAVAMIGDGSLLTHALSSVQVVMIGFALSSLVAVPVGLWMGTYAPVRAAIEPVVNFIRYLPVTSFVPLFILWIGIGLQQRVTVIVFGVFFQQLVMVADSARGIARDLVNAAYTLGTKRSEVVWHIVFPATLPAILDMLRVTAGWAWTYLVVAELVAASSGLGYISLRAMRGFQVDTIFLAVLTIGFLGLVTDLFFRLLRRKLAPWAM